MYMYKLALKIDSLEHDGVKLTDMFTSNKEMDAVDLSFLRGALSKQLYIQHTHTSDFVGLCLGPWRVLQLTTNYMVTLLSFFIEDEASVLFLPPVSLFKSSWSAVSLAIPISK